MNKDVIAAIITYNPNIDLLSQNVQAIINQVNKTVIYDNNSSNVKDIENLCKVFNVQIIKNFENQGVAGPLHDSAILANKLGYKYILTLDQDSVAFENMVTELKKSIQSSPQIAMACAQNNDDRFYQNESVDKFKEELITSGTLADVDVILSVGNYIKELFIDWVDFEICFRLISSGYKLIKSANAKINHSYGEPTVNKYFNRKIFIRNYSPFRLYYQARNIKFCKLKYPHLKIVKNHYKKTFFRYRIKILLYEKNKLKKLKSMHKGFKHAKRFYKSLKN